MDAERLTAPATDPREPRWLSPHEVALRCSLSRSAVYRAIRSGDLVASRIRSRIRIDVAEVDDWMNRHRIEPPDQATPRKVEGPVVGFRTLIDRRRGSS